MYSGLQFFFLKQKTAYEMRISDWSSDVCSSDLALILDRVERYGSDSDTALFTELLYAGEFIVKATTAAFVSAIEDDRQNHRYRLLHGLDRKSTRLNSSH